MDQMQLFLKEVEAIFWKYRQHLDTAEYRFNVFSILRQADDEVHLHSRFLGELLDPDGDHCQGRAFLAAFLGGVGIRGFRMHSVLVRREYRDVDILVANENQAVIIENKIYAQDQKRQLERYYDAIRKEGFDDIFIVYLTLDGTRPSRYSMGRLLDKIRSDRLYLVSYRDDIRTWLDECVAISNRLPALRETLIQYQRLVERLTSRLFSRGHIMELKRLLSNEKNIALAVTVSEALVEAQIDIQIAFWEELERQLVKAGFRLAEGKPYSSNYSRKNVRRYYETKSAGWHYGIWIKLASFDRETDLVFFVKARKRIQYGFRAYRGDTCKIAQEARFDNVAVIVKEVDPSLERTEYSLGYTTVPRFDFDSFRTPTVFALADPGKREQIVADFAAEMVTRMREFLRLYEDQGAPA